MPDAKDSSTPPSWPLWGPWQIMADMMGTRTTPSPANFTQPILPGWTFGNLITVTERNSSAPDTERDIVAAHSYGRQLGRVIDALAVLIAERPQGAAPSEAFDKLRELEDRIRSIKSEAAVRRSERIRSDLALLKTEKPEEYRRLVSELRRDV
jgi:hypothetical protein